MTDDSTASKDEAPVAWGDLTKFIRQLSHDLRNHLNAAELQSVYLNELVTDAEVKDEIKRLRAMLSLLGSTLQSLSAALAQPRLNRISYGASDLFSDIRQKFETDHADRKADVKWEIAASDALLDVDPQLLQAAVFELLENAFRKRSGNSPMLINTTTKGGEYVLAIRETKPDLTVSTENWGREPLQNISQGHYGLGLNRVRSIVEAHDGRYQANTTPPQAHSLAQLCCLSLLPEPNISVALEAETKRPGRQCG